MRNSVDARSSSLSSMLELFESRERPRIMDARFSLDWNAETEILSDLAPEQELHLFCMMQEAVINALMHSGCDTMFLRIADMLENGLQLPISDNGKGLTAHEDGGHGLHNMQSRAQAAGGQRDYRSGRRFTPFRHRDDHG